MNMSFALTIDAIKQQTKTVTRRLRFHRLKPGDLIQPIEKGMGLKRGETVRKIGPPIRVIAVRREPLLAMQEEVGACAREGFPSWTVEAFMEMFCAHNRVTPDTVITRIEFMYTKENDDGMSVL